LIGDIVGGIVGAVVGSGVRRLRGNKPDR